MRLATIWSLPSMTLAERFRRTGEWAAIKTASKLPQNVRYWATMLELAKATKLSDNVMATSMDEILKNLEKGKK